MSQIHSPAARVKGYVLDLTFYEREETWASTIRQKSMLGIKDDGAIEQFTHVIELLMEDDEVKLRA